MPPALYFNEEGLSTAPYIWILSGAAAEMVNIATFSMSVNTEVLMVCQQPIRVGDRRGFSFGSFFFKSLVVLLLDAFIRQKRRMVVAGSGGSVGRLLGYDWRPRFDPSHHHLFCFLTFCLSFFTGGTSHPVVAICTSACVSGCKIISGLCLILRKGHERWYIFSKGYSSSKVESLALDLMSEMVIHQYRNRFMHLALLSSSDFR